MLDPWTTERYNSQCSYCSIGISGIRGRFSLFDALIALLVHQEAQNCSPPSQLNLALAFRNLLILMFLDQLLLVFLDQLQELANRLPTFIVQSRKDLPRM